MCIPSYLFGHIMASEDLAFGHFGFPFFPLLNAALAPFGFVGELKYKLLSISLVALAGITDVPSC